MLESLLEVAQQVLILFILVGIGFICGKLKVFPESAVKGMTELVLTFVIPCVIVKSFQREYDPSMLMGLGIAVVAAIAVHLLGIFVGMLCLRDKNKARQKVMRFSLVFSNAAFMAVPLQQAILGSDGVFYGAAYIAIFNLLLWSYGLVLMSKKDRVPGEEKEKVLSTRKLILNPGVIGLVVGVTFFLTSFTLPEVVAAPVGHLAALNTPLPMIIVGYHLADAKIFSALKDPKVYLTMFLRLLVVPLIALGALLLCGMRDTMMVAIVIAASAPVGASVTMFSAKFNQDTELSVNLVSISTLLSIATMPLIVSIAQTAV